MLVLLSTDEAEEPSVAGLFFVLSKEWLAARFQEYLAAHPDQTVDYVFDEDAFAAWLARQEGCCPVAFTRVGLGTYGCATRSELYHADTAQSPGGTQGA